MTYPPDIPIPGCTDPTATNYNPSATTNDGSCTYPPPPPNSVPGCTDPAADNYNPNATSNNGTCHYPNQPAPNGTIFVTSNMQTSWTVSGPQSFPGSGTTNGSGYSAQAGTYSISAADLATCSKSTSASPANGSLTSSGSLTFTITYNCTPNNPPPVGPPSCASLAPQASETSGTSGPFYVYAYGVQNTTWTRFPTWSDTTAPGDANSQSDIVWYNGTDMGNGTWRATIDLGNHRPGDPDYGTINVSVYMGNDNPSYDFTPCGGTSFTRVHADQPPSGSLDVADCSRITGWAFDYDANPGPIHVQIYKDGPVGSGTFVTDILANSAGRGDINTTFGIQGDHGFGILTPESLKDGVSHGVWGYAINDNPTGPNTAIGNFTIPACGATVPSVDLKITPPGGSASDGPVNIPYGNSGTLSWTSQNVTACTASDGWSGSKATAGSESTGALQTSKTYSITCSGVHGTATDQVTANVTGATTACSVSASPSDGTYPFTSTPTVTITNWDGTAHEFDIDCTSDGSYETVTYLTTNPSTFSNLCSYSAQSTLSARVRNLNTNAPASCSTSVGHIPIAFNYSLANSGTSNVTKASTDAFTQNTITKTLLAGATQAVSLTVTGQPAGVSPSVANLTCSPTCSSVITFTVTPSAPVGTFPITVTGAPLGKTTTFNLVIAGSPISVSCSATPSTVLVGVPVSLSATVSGGTAPYTYAWSGTAIPSSPAPSTKDYSKTYTTTGIKTAQLTVTDADHLQTTCAPVTIQVNFNPKFEEF